MTTWTTPTQPNETDFRAYAEDQGVPSADLPTSSTYPGAALNYALETALNAVKPGTSTDGYPGPYVMAVYNLAMHWLLKWTPDQSGETFFSTQRTKFRLMGFQSGVTLASGDQATSQTLVVPEFYKTLPLYAQDLLKTPYGRAYLEYAQMYGPTVIGLS